MLDRFDEYVFCDCLRRRSVLSYSKYEIALDASRIAQLIA